MRHRCVATPGSSAPGRTTGWEAFGSVGYSPRLGWAGYSDKSYVAQQSIICNPFEPGHLAVTLIGEEGQSVIVPMPRTPCQL